MNAGCRVAAALILAAALMPPGAAAQDVRALAGWWLSIDDVFPKLWHAGVIPMEELLIINADGRFEDRTMNFAAGDAQACATIGVCSDLPMIASGRLRLAGGTLSITELGVTRNRLDAPKQDPLIRRAAFSTTQPWAVTLSGGSMTLRNASTTRLFARIEPAMLRRLRAGLIASSLSARTHWRCFLSNAMAANPAFASLPRAKGTAALPPLERYLKVASYLNTLSAMARFPLPDDPATRDYVGKDVEQLMIEEFPDVRQPVTLADTQRLKAQIAAVETRVRSKLKERAGGGPAPVTPGRPAISDAEIDAFAQAASEEPAAKRLFCRD